MRAATALLEHQGRIKEEASHTLSLTFSSSFKEGRCGPHLLVRSVGRDRLIRLPIALHFSDLGVLVFLSGS